MYNQKTYLIHHGIKGQKWGIRRYQNEDGSLTSAGRQRYIDSNKKYIFRHEYQNIDYGLRKKNG